jgi:hypothetical protein
MSNLTTDQILDLFYQCYRYNYNQSILYQNIIREDPILYNLSKFYQDIFFDYLRDYSLIHHKIDKIYIMNNNHNRFDIIIDRYNIISTIYDDNLSNYKNRVDLFCNKLGIDINYNSSRPTPLIQLLKSNLSENILKNKIEILLENGADVNILDKHGLSALDYAKQNDNSRFIDILENYNMLYKEPEKN